MQGGVNGFDVFQLQYVPPSAATPTAAESAIAAVALLQPAATGNKS
jgi:hypothetical protein